MAGKNGATPRLMSSAAALRKWLPKRKEEYVPMPEWSEDPRDPELVHVRAMAGPERQNFLNVDGMIDDPVNPGNRIRKPGWIENERNVQLLHRCCLGADGGLLFSAADAEDILIADDPVPGIRLVAACDRVNVLDADTYQAARKNSVAIPSVVSSPSSVSSSESPT